MPTKEELLAKAKQPAEDALRLHPFYRGKVQMMPKCPVRGMGDFAIWYTPGVVAPCRAIQDAPELVYEHTNIWPWEAHEAGARIVATGRGDFPNQVNNSLGFPGIFRGALDVRARTISDEMAIAAAHELLVREGIIAAPP